MVKTINIIICLNKNYNAKKKQIKIKILCYLKH